MSSMIAASWSSKDIPSKELGGNFEGNGGTKTRGARGAGE